MSDWIEQYSAALTERDAREQAHKIYIDAYTKLADRTAAAASQPPPPPSSPTPSTNKDRAGTPSKGKAAAARDTDPPPNELLSRLRADLASTQKARSTLQSEVAELTTSLAALQLQSKNATAQIAQLTRQKADTERKLRDRDEELRGKAKLVEQAQDEMVALGLQLHFAEKEREEMKRDNKELVDRWMKRMGEEVETMNRDSRWE